MNKTETHRQTGCCLDYRLVPRKRNSGEAKPEMSSVVDGPGSGAQPDYSLAVTTWANNVMTQFQAL